MTGNKRKLTEPSPAARAHVLVPTPREPRLEMAAPRRPRGSSGTDVRGRGRAGPVGGSGAGSQRGLTRTQLSPGSWKTTGTNIFLFRLLKARRTCKFL